jgi:hypothetical protein
MNYKFIAYPLIFSEHPEKKALQYSNKVLLPPEVLAAKDIKFPAFFNLKNEENTINVGVHEFTDIPDVMYIPQHIFIHLNINIGQRIDVKFIEDTIPNATTIVLKPHREKFTKLSNPKVILERNISKYYPILTVGDVIKFQFLNEDYNLTVETLEPNKTCSMVDCDVVLEFEKAIDAEMDDKTEEKMHNDSCLNAPTPYSTPNIIPQQISNTNSKKEISPLSLNRKVLSGASVNMIKQKQIESYKKNKMFVPFSGKGYTLGSK